MHLRGSAMRGSYAVAPRMRHSRRDAKTNHQDARGGIPPTEPCRIRRRTGCWGHLALEARSIPIVDSVPCKALLEYIGTGDSMIHRLVWEHLRENTPQAFLNALGISFEVMTMLVLAETRYKPVSHLIPTMIVLRITAALIVWMASSAAFLFVVINRFSQVRERTRQFATLKMLGASSTVILELLFHETMLIAVPGTIA